MRFAVATLLALPIFAAASAVDISVRADSCSGTVECCPISSETTQAKLDAIAKEFHLKSLPNLGGSIGFNCETPAFRKALDRPVCPKKELYCCAQGVTTPGVIFLGCKPTTS